MAKAPERKADRPAATRKATSRAAAAAGELQTLSFGRKNQILLGAGLLALLLGFLFLRFGDITVAPILLVAGYLVLIPWALIAHQGSKPDRKDGDASSQQGSS